MGRPASHPSHPRQRGISSARRPFTSAESALSPPEQNSERYENDDIARALSDAYLDALLIGDEARAETVIRDALEASLTEHELCDEVIAPAMQCIGDLWERGEISVAGEHLASQITLRVLALQREAFRVGRARMDRRIALAAVQGEEHVVGLHMAANLLLHAGYDTSYYGPDVPLAALEAIVVNQAPHVFCFTVTLSTAVPMLRAAIHEVRSLDPDVVVVAGGRGLPRTMRAEPWLALAPSVSGVIETVDALLHRPHLN